MHNYKTDTILVRLTNYEKESLADLVYQMKEYFLYYNPKSTREEFIERLKTNEIHVFPDNS